MSSAPKKKAETAVWRFVIQQEKHHFMSNSNHQSTLTVLRGQKFGRKSPPGRVGVGLVIGGSFQTLARFTRAAGCDLVLYVDVPSEIDSARPGRDVVRITLASGETIGTLTAGNCSEPLKQFLAHRPGVSLAVGLGQMRAIGKLVVTSLLADPSFERFIVTQIFEPLLIKTNGQLEQVDVTVFASTAGGTGGPVAPALAKAVATVFLRKSDAIVHEQFFRVGSLTFVSLGDRVHSNAAATLAEDLHFILETPRDSREVRSLILTEVPMVKANKVERDVLTTQLVQAVRSRAVREILDRTSPNRALDSRLGTVRIINADWCDGLSAERVAQDVVRDYLPRLESIRDAAATPGLLQGITPTPSFEPTPAQSAEALVQLVKGSKGVRPENLINLCLEPDRIYTGGMTTVSLRHSDAFTIGPDILHRFRQPAQSEVEWLTKLATLRTLVEEFENAAAAREASVAEVDRRLEFATRSVEKSLEAYYPKGMGQKLGSLWSAPKAKSATLQNAITQCRELVSEKLQLEAEAQLLGGGAGQLAEILKAEQQRAQGVIDLLRSFHHLGAESGPRQTDSAPLDDILAELITLSRQEGGREETMRLLGSCVRRVTLAGLAEITHAPEVLPESVAQTLVLEQLPIQGPHWGGKNSLTAGASILALPPVTEDLADAIRSHAHVHDGDTQVLSTDTAQAGANVLRLELLEPRRLGEVLTRFYQSALDEARKTREQHTAEGENYLEWAGQLLAGETTSAH